MAGLGFLGSILDEAKRRDQWGSVALVGTLCFLSDLPDFLRFLNELASQQ